MLPGRPRRPLLTFCAKNLTSSIPEIRHLAWENMFVSFLKLLICMLLVLGVTLITLHRINTHGLILEL